MLHLISYILQSVLIYSIAFAYFQGAFPTLAHKHYKRDRVVAITIGAIFGALPILGLVIALLLSDFAKHGVKFK